MDLLDIGIYAGFILFGLAIIGGVLMEAFNLFKDPKSLIKAGAVLVGVVVLFFLAYSLSGDEVTTKYIAVGVDGGTSKIIGAGLILLYMSVFVAFLGMVVSEIYKALK